MDRPEDVYKKGSLTEKLLTPKEERDLARKAKAGDKTAFDRFLQANLRLVVRLASEFNRRCPWVSEPEFVQDGNQGLVCSLMSFDPERGFRFSTYAVPIIRQHMSKGARKRYSLIRLPIRILQDRKKMEDCRPLFMEKYGYEPGHYELGKYAGISDYAARMIECLPTTISLDSLRENKRNSALLEKIPDHSCLDPWRATLESMRLKQLYRALNRLSEKKRVIILRRFGLVTGEPETQESIGRSQKVTKTWIYLQEKQAMEELREHVMALQGACLL